MGRATFCTQLVPNFGYIGYIYEKWVHSWVHVTCKFLHVRVRGGGLPGTDGRPRAGGRLPDGQGGRERAAAGRTGRSRAVGCGTDRENQLTKGYPTVLQLCYNSYNIVTTVTTLQQLQRYNSYNICYNIVTTVTTVQHCMHEST